MFDKIVGNRDIKKSLENAIKIGKISHSYLFIGTEGIGKKQVALEFSKALLCLNGNSCNLCKSCIEFKTQNNPDFNIIEPDGNTIKIEQIRELQKKVAEKPIISNRKIYLIDGCDKMTKEAQNCLLKTLEEPPEYVIIILIGTNESAILSTIKSRCTLIHFQNITDEQISMYLKEHMGITLKDELLLKACGGSIGKAIELKDKEEQYVEIQKLIQNLSNTDMIQIFKNAQMLYKNKEEIYNIFQYINTLLLIYSKKDVRYTDCVQVVENAKKRLQSNANYDMTIDNMLIQMKEKLSD